MAAQRGRSGSRAAADGWLGLGWLSGVRLKKVKGLWVGKRLKKVKGIMVS
jgi:hypothetical protein